MSFKCGIVGLPNVGKSTTFNAITKSKNAEAANFPFCTIEPNVGVVSVPDKRLNNIAKIAARGPRMIRPGIASESSKGNCSNNNGGVTIPIL